MLLHAALCTALWSAVTPPMPEHGATVRVIAYLGTPCLPASQARVTLEGSTITAVSDSFGVAALSAVPAGQHHVIVEYPGLARRRITVRVATEARLTVLMVDLHSSDIDPTGLEEHPVGGVHPPPRNSRASR